MTAKLLCGKVAEEERDQIRDLYLRKLALNELFPAVSKCGSADCSSLYEKVLKDMGETILEFNKWWEEKSIKYAWPNKQGRSWQIDFETCDVYLQ